MTLLPGDAGTSGPFPSHSREEPRGQPPIGSPAPSMCCSPLSTYRHLMHGGGPASVSLVAGPVHRGRLVGPDR